MHRLAQLDHRHVWHPFTQMRDWLRREPIVIVAGRGAVLQDVHGREYLDANASIWTNLHGHNQPRINAAVRKQLRRLAHCSALGLANEPASLLAAKLVALANPWRRTKREGRGVKGEVRSPKVEGRSSKDEGQVAEEAGFLVPDPWSSALRPSPFALRPSPPALRPSPFEPRPSPFALRPSSPPVPALEKVFFSDDGSTAVEVALKLAYEYARRTGLSAKPRFLSLAGAYHGDTVGAVSLGHIDLFHQAYRGLLFPSDQVMAPYCYRCPYNRAKPERNDAREYRRCRWECVDQVARQVARQRRRGTPYAGFVFEPLMQGAAGMIPQPAGWLTRVAELTRHEGTLLVADEVMTAWGRTGEACFASHLEGVQPDFLCVAKGLTGGYLPLAATLTTQNVFGAFLGEYAEFKTFFHGHSYTANPLGAAAAQASLDLLGSADSRRARRRLETELRAELETLWALPHVGDVRQVGLVAGIELVRDWHTRTPFALEERAGMRVCEAMTRRGVLTRPIGNVVVLMPPYCTTGRQVRRMVTALREAVEETFPGRLT
jgi:adenosylmethionine-8-amino-7-oxononanoate aminotransferase